MDNIYYFNAINNLKNNLCDEVEEDQEYVAIASSFLQVGVEMIRDLCGHNTAKTLKDLAQYEEDINYSGRLN